MDRDRSVIGNSLKLLGEVVVPGASELLEGRVASGLAHNLLEGAATLALVGFCPVLASVAVLAIKADSFSRSVNNKSLFTALNVAIGTPTISPPGIPLAKTP
jgi:hypothetical protein